MSIRHFINIEKIVQSGSTPLPVLRGEALNHIETLTNGFITVANGKISAIGKMSDFRSNDQPTVDLSGKWVLPGWVDSHTHTVFAAYRSGEFEMRLQGATYQEIAQAGGGILNSAKKLAQMSEEELFEGALHRVEKIIAKGTVGLEIKSGYGLTLEHEIKMLRVIKRLKEVCPIPIKSTFLGAHALPQEYKGRQGEYIDMVCDRILPLVAEENLADYCDVFCETGYFTAEESRQIIRSGRKHDIPAKIHTNQFTSIGGIEVAIHEAIKSVDHLEVMTAEEIDLLASSDVMAALLPIAPFFLNDPYPKGKSLVSKGASICIASDFNPGSSPSHDMALAVSLGCIKCGLTPNQAINAATINGAHAIDLANELGSLTPGKRANFCVYPSMNSLAEIPYRICSELIEEVIINGESFNGQIAH